MANNSSISISGPFFVLDYYWVLEGVIAFFTVFGNMVIIVLVLRCAALRTKQNWFVLSLAVADFFVGIGFCLEIIATYECYQKNYNVGLMCLGIIDFFTFASMTNLCALTLDRHLAITYPLKHRSFQSKSNVTKTLAMAWFVAFLISFINVVLVITKSTEISKGYVIFMLLFFATFPCVALPIAYFHLLSVVSRRHRAQVNREGNELQHNHATIRHRRNKGTLRVLGGVIGFFVLTHVLNIYCYWLYNVAMKPSNKYLVKIGYILISTNSANNVICYGLFKKDFRYKITKLCRRFIPQINVSSQAYTLPQPRGIVNETAL